MYRSDYNSSLEIAIKTINELRRGLGSDKLRGLSRVKFHLSEAKELLRKEINRRKDIDQNG
jgi:CRISPR/Cas system CSM-associated protein Csm3 (group 7 of RAMP superfamily)